tara:strand:+ start:126 stop:320 length:195 start_codon:yes stop_codon:yes gene_type:complete
MLDDGLIEDVELRVFRNSGGAAIEPSNVIQVGDCLAVFRNLASGFIVVLFVVEKAPSWTLRYYD